MNKIKTIIIGKRSNLSKKLMDSLANVILFSSSNLENELSQLKIASCLNDLTSQMKCIEKLISFLLKGFR